MTNRKRVCDRTEPTVDSFRRRTVTIHYSSNRTIRKQIEDEDTERRIKSIGR